MKHNLRELLISFLFIGVLLQVTGCTALLIGGAATGGYIVGKDDRPVSTIVDDGAITTQIQTKMIADKYVPAASVSVDTYQGVVTLHGNVTSYIARDRAEAIARDTKGVQSVKNNIVVVSAE